MHYLIVMTVVPFCAVTTPIVGGLVDGVTVYPFAMMNIRLLEIFIPHVGKLFRKGDDGK